MARAKKPVPEQSPAIAKRVEAELKAIRERGVAPMPATEIAPNKPPVRRYTIAETRDQVRAVEEMLVEGGRPAHIHRILRGSPGAPGRYPEITKARVELLCERIRRDWASIAKDDQRLADREAAIRRIHESRRIARGVRDPSDPRGVKWLVPPNHQAIARYESLLMELQGTKESVKVDVEVRYTEAMLGVVGSLSGERGTELLEEAMEQARLAGIAVRELPAHVLDAEVVATDPTGSVGG